MPVFITGLSHSGKTPLRAAFEASGEIAMTRKTYLWPRFQDRFGDLSEPKNLGKCLDTILADPGVRRLTPDRRRIEEIYSTGPSTYTRLFAAIHRQHAEGIGVRRWGDQLGSADRHAGAILGEIADAVFLHLLRDPRDRAGFTSRQPGALGWETRKWIESARSARVNSTRHPHNYHTIRYEAMRSDPEECLRSVCLLVDVSPSERMLNALRAGLATKADPRTLGERGVAYVTRRARSELTELGYATSEGAWSASVLPIELVGAGARWVASHSSATWVRED